MCETKRAWVTVLVVAALATLVGLAGCAGGPQRLPQCTGKAERINAPVHAAGSAGSDQRGQ